MTAILLVIAVTVTLAGAAYELSLLSVSRALLTEAVTRRLRGGDAPLAWPVETERELAAASTTTSIGMVMLGALIPGLVTTESVIQLLVLLLLLAVPFAMLSGYLLPRWLSHGRAERMVTLLRPAIRPWAALLRVVLPTASEATGEYRAIGRESAAVLPETDAEMAMVGGVMTFAQRPVRDVMTPRTALVAVPDGATVADISRAFAESGYSRVPVYRETLDEIVGMVHAFDLFKLQPGDPLPIRPVALAPASRTCGDLLVDMQRERRHLAVVLDEFGGTLGIVTLEDLLRALVGEIYDEDPRQPMVEPPRPLLLEVDGSAAVTDVQTRLGLPLPSGQAGTIGGRLAELIGRIPVTGERHVLGGIEFDVLQASPNRVERIVIRPAVPPSLAGTPVMSRPARSVADMLKLLRTGQLDEFLARAADFESADLADVLAQLDEDQRLEVVKRLPAEVSAGALVEMPDEAHAEDTLAELDPMQAAEIVEELQDDDAADILQTLERETQERILSQVEDRADVDRLLSYDEETAGGRMTAQVVTAMAGDTLASALASIRSQAGEQEDFSQIFVIDETGKLQGTLSLKALVVNPPDRAVREVMEAADLTVPPEMDQEQVARLMSRYNVPSIAVVDQGGKLLGRVTFDDVIDVVEAETTEDMLRFGGVSADEDLAAPWNTAIQTRLPWLFVNLLTAFLAASVVVLFQDTLARTLALTAWMPIIAGMGGNAGTQALAVTVRRLALGQIQTSRFLGVIAKELAVGLINGLAIGVAVSVVALVTGQGPRLGLVVFLAMSGNLIVAGFAGAFIPLLLQRLKIDPAIASSVFVTTFTDMCGFALLLGLAGSILL